jgi:hypothetical protein
VGSFPLLRVRGETRSTCPGRVTAREERALRLALWHRALVGVVRRFLYLIRGTNDRLEFLELSRGVCSKITRFYRFLTKSSYQTNLFFIEMTSALMPLVTPSTPTVRPGCLAPGSPSPRCADLSPSSSSSSRTGPSSAWCSDGGAMDALPGSREIRQPMPVRQQPWSPPDRASTGPFALLSSLTVSRSAIGTGNVTA